MEELKRVAATLFQQEQDVMETTALYFFERLTLLYQLNLMLTYEDKKSRHWIRPAVQYFTQKQKRNSIQLSKPPAEETIRQMIGWELG